MASVVASALGAYGVTAPRQAVSGRFSIDELRIIQEQYQAEVAELRQIVASQFTLDEVREISAQHAGENDLLAARLARSFSYEEMQEMREQYERRFEELEWSLRLELASERKP